MADWDLAGPLDRGFNTGFNARIAGRRQKVSEDELAENLRKAKESEAMDRAKMGGGTTDEVGARMARKQTQILSLWKKIKGCL